jgi:Uma2 family endonuclease
MLLTIEVPESEGGRLRLPPQEWTEDEFFDFCQANGDLRIERTAKGEIIVMSPAGGYSSFQSGEVFWQLKAWAERDGTGLAFDCSGGFLLPTGGMRSPDAAWLKRSRLEKLTQAEKEKFIPLCPDFLIEVASPSDRLPDLLEKMEEYRQSGLPLGWLILPKEKQVRVYSNTAAASIVLEAPERVSADPVVPGFTLELVKIWEPPF